MDVCVYVCECVCVCVSVCECVCVFIHYSCYRYRNISFYKLISLQLVLLEISYDDRRTFYQTGNSIFQYHCYTCNHNF